MKNLKLIAAGILLFGATTFVNAQTTTTTSSTTKTASFGVKGGVNFANIRGNDFDGPDARTSFHVGVLGEFPMTNAFSVQVEALYSGQGFKSNVDGGIFGGNGDVEYQLDYINVPVLAKIYLTDGLSVEVGPQFNFKVNEEVDTDANNNGGDTDTDAAKDFDFGVAGGLTFQSEMGLFATGRYTLGLTDVFEDADAKNSVFQIGIGYKF